MGALFLQYGVPLLIAIAQKTGLVNWLEALALKGGLAGVQELKKVKVYNDPQNDYPKGKNGT